ncbi:sorbitol dehydrogenase [Mycolicibacterium smegmatis MKD8]|uniref:Sorbitol dehydrogenase n=2 Tax=Mycolicibacterium smegmatis TaxID=1772 RepID=A0A2U9PI76_MYCSE|nr:sorbitol dehydrogenase [Mycolicibacterium smegmatis MKD8]
MTRTGQGMRAVVLSEERTIELQERPIPELRPGQVLLRSHYCGICGSDLHAPDLQLYQSPVVMGHEFSAEIVAVGTQVQHWHAGMRVVVNPNGNACGSCNECKNAQYNLCHYATHVESTGVCRDGGMAEYVAVSGTQLHELPDSVDSLQGAWTEPLAVALRAVKHSGIRLGDRVTVIGGGPIGLLAVQLARRAGAAEVTLVEPSAKRREVGRAVGADYVYEPGEHSSAVAEKAIRPADRVLECSGHQLALQSAIDMSRPGGAIQLVAISPRPISFDPMSAIAKEVRIDAKFIYVDEFAKAIDLLARNQVETDSLTTLVVGLDEYRGAFDSLSKPDSHIKALIRTGA